MNHILVDMLSQMTTLTPEEKALIQSSFPIKTFDKGTHVLREGMIAENAFFVIKGCIREYQLLEAEEKTTAFYLEDDSAIDFSSQSRRIPSSKFFQCTEQTTVAILNAEKEKALYKKCPRFERFCREGMEAMMGAQQEALSTRIISSPRERYLLLLEDKPGLINRVPQYQIASYLGIKPETLSRVRKRLSVEKRSNKND